MLREILARLWNALMGERRAPAARRAAEVEDPWRSDPSLFSRERREAARRRDGGEVGRRGMHGGPPADAGFHKDGDARAHR
jgi:hypothetical protein